MTDLVSPEDDQKRNAREKVTSPSSHKTLRPTDLSPKERRMRLIAVSLLGCALLFATLRIASFSPVYQEWRYNRMPLEALLKEHTSRPENPRLLFQIGKRLNDLGRFAEAEPYLQHAVGLDPDTPQLRDAWSRSQLGIGQITEAFGQLRQYAGTHDNALAHLYLGKFYFVQRSMERASEELERSVALDAKQAEGWAYLSQAKDQLGDRNRPLEAMRKAIELQPNSAGYRLLLANLLTRTNDREGAGKEMQTAATLSPKDPVIQQQYADWLGEQSGDPTGLAKAEQTARNSLAIDSASGQTHLTLGKILLRQKRSADAIPSLSRAAELLPDNPLPARLLAQAFRESGKVSDADLWQKQADQRVQYTAERNALYQQLRVHPEDRGLHLRMARLLCSRGDVDGCISNHAMALRRPKDNALTLANAAKDLAKAGFGEKSLPLAQRAVEKGQSSPDTHEALGDALLATGKIDDAIAQYNFTTTYRPAMAAELQGRVNRYAAAHPVTLTPAQKAFQEARNLMNGQIGLQRIPLRAEELVKQAISLDPANVEYLRLLLRIQFGAKKMEEALQTGRAILNVTPDDAKTHALLGVILADRAKPDELAEAEKHLAAANTPETLAQRHYGKGLLALKRQQGKEALSELQEAARLDPGADITYYKIYQAHKIAGDAEAAQKALALYQKRIALKRQEFEYQGNISQNPNSPVPYKKLMEFYRQQGRAEEALAIERIIQQRFPTAIR